MKITGSRLFRQYLKRGHGRAYIILQSAQDIEKYRPNLLWGCLNGFAYDAQCEGSRAFYLYTLVSLFPDKESFLPKICQKYLSLSTRLGWEYLHFSELLDCFARDGSDMAEQALHDKYNAVLQKMMTKKHFDIYDNDRECLEHSAIILSSRSIEDWMNIAADLGRLVIENSHYREHFVFDWFIDHSEDLYKRERLIKLLEKAKKTSNTLCAFYDAYTSQIEENDRIRENGDSGEIVPPSAEDLRLIAESEDHIPLSNRVRFRRLANDNEKKKLADALEQERDPETKAKLLSAFIGYDYPGSKEKLIEYTESKNKALREAALNVFSDCRGEIAAVRALKMLAEKEAVDTALCVLISNYKREYKAVVLDTLESEKLTDDEIHGIVMTINDAKDFGIYLPREFFEYAYENSPCACCRETIVRYMSKHGWLTREIAEECLYDCNDDTSNYIRRYYSKFLI